MKISYIQGNGRIVKTGRGALEGEGRGLKGLNRSRCKRDLRVIPTFTLKSVLEMKKKKKRI